MINHIKKNSDWLCLIVALYGGYTNYNTRVSISEYYEIAQYLDLSDNERAPFALYYQEVWDRDDPLYSMALHLDTVVPKYLWNEKPKFDKNKIYKESFLTTKILELLNEEKSTKDLIEELRQQMMTQRLSTNDKIEALTVLIVLGDYDVVNVIINEEETFRKSFGNRIEQLISVLKDPIARWSSHIEKYLITIYDDMKMNPLQYNLKFSDYCKIYLSLMAASGGLPVEMIKLAEAMDNVEDKYSLYAEHIVFKFTGADSDLKYNVAVVLDEWIRSCKIDQIINSFLKISDTVQIYRPVRAYPWVTDMFIFKSNNQDDIPIAFINCLENINTNITFIIEAVSDVLVKEEYVNKNPELVPLVILLTYGVMSKDLDKSKIYNDLLPELVENPNTKEFLLEKIQSMCDPYYKSRALYQLAEFDDEKSYQLLNESFRLTKMIPEPVLKFQVLEKIFNIVHYKEVEHILFIQQIVDELISTFNDIEGLYDRVIASVRLSFYGSAEFRKMYLTNAVETLSKMNENDDKIRLIIKLKPLVNIYDDLQMKLDGITESLRNKTHNQFVNTLYGRILSTEKLHADTSNSTVNVIQKLEDVPDYAEFHSLFLLFAQLNDTRLMIGQTDSTDQLWMNLLKDADNQSNIETVLNIGLKNELFLTPQAAIIIDELINKNKEDMISILFPYIIKPSNEVLPIVQRWFTNHHNSHIKKLAALLLAEAKHIFESAVDIIIDLLKSDNDQMRYRAQRIFQHPERSPSEASKRISVLGEKTLLKILENMLTKEHLLRVRTYLSSFFYDLLWDDPKVFQNLHQGITELKERNSTSRNRMWFFNKIDFINDHTWHSIIQSLQSPSYPSYVEELLQSTMILAQRSQITEENWTEFATILSITNTSQFREKLYFTCTETETIQFILDEICTSTNMNDETYFQILESKIIHQTTVKCEDLSQCNYERIKHISDCSFYSLTRNLNQTVLNMLNDVLINVVMMENSIRWLIRKIASFKGFDDTIYVSRICTNSLLLVSACVQKEDYLYRKITNSPNFNKIQMIKLLEKIVINHRSFAARGSAFILLSAMDQIDHKVIMNVMNTFLDENLVKQYSLIGIPLIQLSSIEFIDDLLESLKNESAIKVYELLKIMTQIALSERIDANSKSKIIDYLTKQIGELKSKKIVNYYYTDIKIPFTTTLENELYKTWIKIQGLEGKTQYSINTEQSKE